MYWLIDWFQTTSGVVTAVLIGASSYCIWRFFSREDPLWKSQGVPVFNVGIRLFYKDTVDLQLKALKKSKADGSKSQGTSLLGMRMLTSYDPDLIKEVFVRDFDDFHHRGTNFAKEPILNEMLVAITDIDKWKRVRSVMSPTFSIGKLRRMRKLVEECTKIMIKNIETLKNERNEVDMKKVFGAFAMEVVTQVAFGTKVDSLIDEYNPLIANASKFFRFDNNPIKIFRMFIALTFPKVADFFNIRMFDQKAMLFFKSLTLKLVEERRRSNSKQKRCDFLQLMLDAVDNNMEKEEEPEEVDKLQYYSQDGGEYHKIATHNKTLTEDEIIAQALLFFFAGYETTVSAVSYAAHLLAVNQDVQKKLYEEVEETLKKEKEVTYDVIMSLKYLDAVVCETLRLYPANANLFRVAARDVTLSNGIRLPKDCAFQVMLVALHRDPDNFPDPESFKPERFFPENRCHHPFAYLPFGAGPRNCIGMRLALMDVKLALFHFVLNYQFTLLPNSPEKPNNVVGGMLSPKQLVLCVENRNR